MPTFLSISTQATPRCWSNICCADLQELGATGSEAALQRPPLATIFGGDEDTAALAGLIYLPLVSIVGFAVFFLLNLRRSGSKATIAATLPRRLSL